MLTAGVAFDAEKRHYTLEEGNALKKELLKFMKQPATVVNFVPLGQALLEEGRLREGLDEFRKLAAERKEQAVNHVRLARAYLVTGCGEEARKEAKAATQRAPTLALTWRNLAFVEEHDLVGRKYKPGWDPVGTEAALHKAITLDADDLSARVEMAESFSYDSQGSQYLAKDRLTKAVEVLDSLGDDKVAQRSAQDMLIYDLAVLGELDEMKAKLERFGANGSRAGYHIFLTAVQEGAAKAAAEVKGLPGGEEAKQSFLSAANLLARTGRYQLEGDLATGAGFESQLFMPPANLRNVRSVDWRAWKTDSPENAVKSFIAAQFETSENAGSLARFWSHPGSARLRLFLGRSQQAELNALTQRGLIAPVARDVYLSSTAVAMDSNGPDGVRVRLTTSGRTIPMLLVREQGEFKLLGNGKYTDGVARQIVAELDAGHPEVARKWLDWMREDVKIRSQDDPLGGPVFPRLWNKGATGTPAQIRQAAATLMSPPDAFPILREAISSTSDTSLKAYYQLAYAEVCVYLKRWADCVPVAKALAEAYPASDTTLRLLSHSLAGLGQVDAAETLLKKAIAENMDVLAPKRELVNVLSLGKRLKEAEQAAKETAETPTSAASDWNQYGWVSLFVGDTNDEKIHAVERASSQPNLAIDNTIAAMYAETGRVNEARQISLQSMDRFGYRAPDSAWWYVFGRVAEQLGAMESAAVYYAKVEPDENGDDAQSVHVLAQKRLALVKTATAASSR
jgi:tetratricopeptide (TPR) repeat protein